jgi:hypothetical protein
MRVEGLFNLVGPDIKLSLPNHRVPSKHAVQKARISDDDSIPFGSPISEQLVWKRELSSLLQCFGCDSRAVFLLLILDCEAIGTAPTPGLLCQPRVIVKMIVEKQMECRLAGETEVLGEHLPQLHFCPSQNPT